LVGEYFDRVEMLMTNPTRLLGIPTGFGVLDDLILGLQKTDLVILAGRPGMGKTAMLGQIALNAARLGARVGIFTMEMSEEQLTQRLVSADTGINLQSLSKGSLTDLEWSQFVRATSSLSKLPIEIDDRPALTPQKIRAKAYQWLSEQGIDLIIVDYIQKMSDGGLYKGDRVQAVGYFARSLKDLAKELHLPILSAAQLSRKVEERNDKRPMLSDLRDSGEIEQEADIVAFLYRDVYYNAMTEFPLLAEVIVEKHRNGPTGTVNLGFEQETTRFMAHYVRQLDWSGLDHVR
jgi:replicative DNA helicase